MKTVAFHTLGCKVNQYDSQAMLERFLAAGYEAREFDEFADVYVVNTCTVTAVGDKKSMQAVRRALRQNPAAHIVIAGCLAQKQAGALLSTGARLILGTSRRAAVVTLLEEAVEENKQIVAVTDVTRARYEDLSVTGQAGRTRAVLKIQEGCDRFCAYCAIPSVRGGIRSRAVESVRQEAQRLADAGYQELVLTGVHLTSYGRDLENASLLSAIAAACAPEGVSRVRLGSLEPVIATDAFVEGLRALPKVCPQFHLALQSGSETVLSRMRRRYTPQEFLQAAERLRAAFPGCALTTDVLAGFPGETEAEHAETLAFCRAVGFAKMHVFPYSRREGTLAARMPGQLPKSVKEARARELIALGETLANDYRASLLRTVQPVLFEEDGAGYTPQYMHARAPGGVPGEIRPVRLLMLTDEGFSGEIAG